jgi:23S rRNA (uracil1939-C5)-methyltransferase
LSYQKQLEIKQNQVASLFGEMTRPIIPCAKEWGYRNKMEFSFSQDKEGNRYLGLVIDSSKGKVFKLTECHLPNRWFQEALQACRSWWEGEKISAYHPFRQTGTLRNLTLREGIQTGDRMVILHVSGNPEFALKKGELESFKQTMSQFVPENGRLSLFLKITQTKKGMRTQEYEMHLSGPDHILEKMTLFGRTYTFKISPAAFFQPNTIQAMELFTRAFELVSLPKEGMALDLYCGTGVLGILAASFGMDVTGIELSPEAVLDARENSRLNQVDSISFLQGRVEEELSKVVCKPDLVMVDPPRAGLDAKAIDTLLKLKSPKILYISCHPQSQKENVDLLCKGGYRIEAVQPVDQFPHTFHIENIVVLAR